MKTTSLFFLVLISATSFAAQIAFSPPHSIAIESWSQRPRVEVRVEASSSANLSGLEKLDITYGDTNIRVPPLILEQIADPHLNTLSLSTVGGVTFVIEGERVSELPRHPNLVVGLQYGEPIGPREALQWASIQIYIENGAISEAVITSAEGIQRNIRPVGNEI